MEKDREAGASSPMTKKLYVFTPTAHKNEKKIHFSSRRIKCSLKFLSECPRARTKNNFQENVMWLQAALGTQENPGPFMASMASDAAWRQKSCGVL